MRFALVIASLLLATPALANDTPAELQENFLAALVANDLDGVVKCYASDATYYPVSGGLAATGTDEIRASWGGFLEMAKVISCDMIEANEQMAGDDALAWGIWEMSAIMPGSPDPVTMQGRFMDLSRKIDGSWRYVVDHASMPLPPPPPAPPAE